MTNDKRPSLKEHYDKHKMYHVTGRIRHGTTVLSKRVWWKPWTWRRKKIFIGGEWEKMDYTYAAPSKEFVVLPTTVFTGSIDEVTIEEVEAKKLFFEEDDFSFDDDDDVFFTFE